MVITPSDAEIVDAASAFVREMPARVARFQRMWEQQRLDDLQRAARDLAMVGAGMGFGEIAAAAGTLGRTLTDLFNGRPPRAGGGSESLRSQFGCVVTVCRVVSR